ncbi:hypothetical protein K431DRAFT_311434 [Polychaeton citri CBS 116435]|uniref:DNA replication regulator Sld3 C-terminal domain-containing protein n=1 Tax=Polychaeton citri CBS 116435 TaxID=1314669 RepID=A0A9P4QDB7_9PEZI|nr:hypothetical protein K431DRAFT_311434 [Polychaeton citri CBS 116435]
MSLSLSSTSLLYENTSKDPVAGPLARKRKRGDSTHRDADRKPFIVKPASRDVYQKPILFAPICTLDRAQLPLSYIDTSLNGSRLFQTSAVVFEVQDEERLAAPVLIARNDVDGALCAIERVQWRQYAMCRLGAWVTEELLRNKVSAGGDHHARKVKRKVEQQAKGDSLPWWSTAAVETAGGAMVGKDPGLRFGMLRQQSHDEGDIVEAKQPDVEELQDQPPEVQSQLEQDPQRLSPTQVLEDLTKHYLETLYISRTSLAYFIKGPLSRVRAAFTNSEDATFDSRELLDFLKEVILGSNAMDKKFRETLPEAVKEVHSASLETPEQSKQSRKKRKWKSGRGKSGFFGNEKEFVSRWWASDIDAGQYSSAPTGVDELLRTRLPRLRSRETYLQVILVLEVLSLEAAIETSSMQNNPEPAPCLKIDEGESQGMRVEGKKKKPKKLVDLAALLETLLDKLCIWHSLDGGMLADDAQDEMKSQPETNDEPSSFCMEVIIPFYLSRLPKQAAMVNKKLGGPTAPSPQKRKNTSVRRPGEVASRSAPARKIRDPLHRVSSDTSSARKSKATPAILHRSATDSQIESQPRIKRENSQTPSLHSIPTAAVPQPRKRSNLLQELAKREVDFSAATRATQAKMRKKAEVEEKLREAISTLKKPNRSLATREVADAADLSFAKATEKKRPGQPVRRERLAFIDDDDGVHVAATPSHRRMVKATSYKSHGSGHFLDGSSKANAVPSSSARMMLERDDAPSTAIPATGHRQRYMDFESKVHNTNAKQPVSDFAPEAAIVSPVMNRRSSALVTSTPSKPRKLDFALHTPIAKINGDRIAVPGSTLQPPTVAMEPELSPVAARQRKQNSTGNGTTETQNNIYDALGWNDDFDDLV